MTEGRKYVIFFLGERSPKVTTVTTGCPGQRLELDNQRFEEAIFFAQGLQFFFLRHGPTLVGFISFGKSIGDLSSY